MRASIRITRAVPGLLLGIAVLIALPGCTTTGQARYVYQDGEFGVVGIPSNTDRWPSHYRRQAEALMETHFPAGHEVVRAEEVVEGSRTLTVQGTNNAEIVPKLPTDLFSIGKLGHSSSHNQADTLKIKECRIIYKRTPRADTPADYADISTLSPTLYVDPNSAERRKPEAEKASSPPKPAPQRTTPVKEEDA